ncbi:sensor histidine kinase [Sinimarinibacterium thermocellulolyticum]|uniref:ATP-binding protein n=1 Tax=Sinimarinibacterium thermocellulolyticum TaxID=3170016 RepID=A0ABV2A9T9_9GAMM
MARSDTTRSGATPADDGGRFAWVRRLWRRAPAAAASIDAAERERIAAQERARIFRDLHDDIGVKLLALLHTVNDVRQADLVRSVIYDLRDIVSRSRRPPGTLLEVLAQIRDEMEQRLEALGVQLAWLQKPTPDVPMSAFSALNLFRITREAVTNAIRHARAREIHVHIACEESMLMFAIVNDGGGLPRAPATGTGTLGMRERASALGGSLHWSEEPGGGVRVTLRVPLAALESATAGSGT